MMTVHSSNVTRAFDLKPDLCVYAGVPSAMYIANDNPQGDLEVMRRALDNIRRINPVKLILISTISVYPDPYAVDENSIINNEGHSAYGKNRYLLERWVREDFPNVQIVRLPALFGVGLKKNFLYDLHHIIPKMIKMNKFQEIAGESSLVRNSYMLQGDYYVIKNDVNRIALRHFFENNDFNALTFTDSRSKFQFYGLSRLWDDLNIVMEMGIPVINIVSPPIAAIDIYEMITQKRGWNNILDKPPFNYDVRSKYANEFGGVDGYIMSRQSEQTDILNFMRSWEEIDEG